MIPSYAPGRARVRPSSSARSRKLSLYRQIPAHAEHDDLLVKVAGPLEESGSTFHVRSSSSCPFEHDLRPSKPTMLCPSEFCTQSPTPVSQRCRSHVIRAIFCVVHARAGNVPAFPGILPDQQEPDQIGRSDDLVTSVVLAILALPKKAALRRPWQDPRRPSPYARADTPLLRER